MVPAYFHVYGAVELDARHFGPTEQLPHMNVMDGVACDGTERGAQAADDARLLAIGDGVVANDVVANGFFVPAVLEGSLDSFNVTFSGIGRFVILFVTVFPESDSRTY